MKTPVDTLRECDLPTDPVKIVDNILKRFRWGGTSEQGWNRVNTYCGILPAFPASGETVLSLTAINQEVRQRLKSLDTLSGYELQKLLDLEVTLGKTIEYRTSPTFKGIKLKEL